MLLLSFKISAHQRDLINAEAEENYELSTFCKQYVVHCNKGLHVLP